MITLYLREDPSDHWTLIHFTGPAEDELYQSFIRTVDLEAYESLVSFDTVNFEEAHHG